MKNALVALLLLLSITKPGLIYAVVHINPQDIRENDKAGLCAWASMETLMRHHGIHKEVDGKGFMERCRGIPAYDYEAEAALKREGIKYRMTYYGNDDYSLLEWAIANDLGAVCYFNPGAFGTDAYGRPCRAHAVVMIDFNKKEVGIVDTNYPGQTFTAARSWFDQYSQGVIIVLLPENPRPLSLLTEEWKNGKLRLNCEEIQEKEYCPHKKEQSEVRV